MTEPKSKSQRMRDFLKANGPCTDMEVALGMGWLLVHTQQLLGTQIKSKMVSRVAGIYTWLRDPVEPLTDEERKQRQRDYDAGRSEARCAKRKAERLARIPVKREPAPRKSFDIRLVQSKDARKRDHEVRTAEHVASAQATRNKQHGVTNRPAHAPLPCSSAFIDANPHLHHVLGNGVVSPASQFQRLEIRA